jgi:hypothetical protein
MARDPRGVWAAMPRPHLPLRKRRPPGAGKARKETGVSASSETLKKIPEAVRMEGGVMVGSGRVGGHSGARAPAAEGVREDWQALLPALCSLFRSGRRYLSPERLASVRREDPRSRTTSSSSNCSAKKEG